MYIRKTTVINKSGLHARPASDFVSLAKQYTAKIRIANLSRPEEDPVNAKSMIGLLALAIAQDTEVELRAEGDDARQAVDALIAFIDGGLGEE